MAHHKNIFELTLSDLARLLGANEDEIMAEVAEVKEGMDFHYERFSLAERDQLILSILKRIESDDLAVVGENRKSDWERGWGENLDEFINSGCKIQRLVPKYFKKNVPVRLNRDYVMPSDPDFVFNLTRLFRMWLFKKYLSNIDVIYEFGCGSAHHLAFLANLYPLKKLYGLDWAQSSQEIIHLLSERHGFSIKGYNFDFFHPDEGIEIEPNSAVYTFGALEQIGKDHEPFLRFLLQRSPELCINIEGLHELYAQEYLLDYLALKYHKRRKYLDGYLTRLWELEKDGKIEIIKVHHQRFGNLFDDPHSYVIWRPKKGGV